MCTFLPRQDISQLVFRNVPGWKPAHHTLRSPRRWPHTGAQLP